MFLFSSRRVDTGIFVAGQRIRLYAAPGSEVQLLMRRDSNQGAFNFHPGLSGYLIDPNSPSVGP